MTEGDRPGRRSPHREQLDAIRAREQAATAGPWHAPGMGEVHSDHDHGVFTGKDIDGQDECVVADTCTDGNAEFIAKARTDIPFLLALVDKLDAALLSLPGPQARSPQEPNKDMKTEHLCYRPCCGKMTTLTTAWCQTCLDEAVEQKRLYQRPKPRPKPKPRPRTQR